VQADTRGELENNQYLLITANMKTTKIYRTAGGGVIKQISFDYGGGNFSDISATIQVKKEMTFSAFAAYFRQKGEIIFGIFGRFWGKKGVFTF